MAINDVYPLQFFIASNLPVIKSNIDVDYVVSNLKRFFQRIEGDKSVDKYRQFVTR
jgi:hypothetical protein